MPCCWWSLQTRKHNGSNTGQGALKYCCSSRSLHPPAPPLILITVALSVWQRVADCKGNWNISDVPVPSACGRDKEGWSHRCSYSRQCSQNQLRMGFEDPILTSSLTVYTCQAFHQLHIFTVSYLGPWTLGQSICHHFFCPCMMSDYKTDRSEPFANWPPAKRHT